MSGREDEEILRAYCWYSWYPFDFVFDTERASKQVSKWILRYCKSNPTAEIRNSFALIGEQTTNSCPQ